MIQITPDLAIDEGAIQIEFVRSSGPGGQNVNKVATAAQLRFDIYASQNLPWEVKNRLLRIAGRKVTSEGILIIEAKRYRTQEANREDAIERLSELIRRAVERPKKRRPTTPSAAAKEKRLQEKKRRGEIKRSRNRGDLE